MFVFLITIYHTVCQKTSKSSQHEQWASDWLSTLTLDILHAIGHSVIRPSVH